MRMVFAAVSLVALSAAASAAPQPERVRGTVVSANDTTITVKGSDGATKTITVTPATKFLSVVKSSLDNVTDGKFIGTATKGDNPPTALEVVIFPASMKGTGEGHYDWDTIKDTTAESGGMTKSAMTNGMIKSSAAWSGAMTKSAMTNGTVKASAGASGGKSITVTYDNGKSLEITVPPSAPIVEFEPADKSIVRPGVVVFSSTLKDGSTQTARSVAVGKDGVTPPM